MREESSADRGDVAVEGAVLELQVICARDEGVGLHVGEVVADRRIVAPGLQEQSIGCVLELPCEALHPGRSGVEDPPAEGPDLGGERRACAAEVVGCSQVFSGYHLIHLREHRIIHI